MSGRVEPLIVEREGMWFRVDQAVAFKPSCRVSTGGSSDNWKGRLLAGWSEESPGMVTEVTIIVKSRSKRRRFGLRAEWPGKKVYGLTTIYQRKTVQLYREKIQRTIVISEFRPSSPFLRLYCAVDSHDCNAAEQQEDTSGRGGDCSRPRRKRHRLMRGGALQVGGLARGRQCLSRVGMSVVYSEMQEAQEIKKRSSKHQARFDVKADSQAYLNIMLHELLNFPMVPLCIIKKKKL
ncbi:hypothetical protein ALC62_02032 [Cyphomyrmex costatus]|uniref:Uncharacterized protein n=1 Tax=Cyphomyrmex costatus TaxID=456900 RepID=A0A151ING2_9HYME|nr:hypothetical protein ALC62_02032 [Cyphomyrmex costatus]